MRENLDSLSKLSMVFLVAAMVLMAGCAKTQRIDADHQLELKSHFLGPKIVSMLKVNEDDEERAGRGYINPNAKWASYDKLIVDPVTVWKDEGTKDVDPEDLQRLANDFWSKIRDEMGKDYKIVHEGGPGVMRIQTAITEAEASDPTMDTVTSIIPQTRLLTGAKGIAAGGKPGFVGAASIEMKVTDTKTGELLGAAIDRRAGTKNISGATNEWGDIEDNYTFWAKRLRFSACELREGKKETSKCEKIKPEE